MELPVRLQLLELLNAICTGAALGLLYDLLRPFRRGRWTTALADLLYGVLMLLTLLLFTLYHGRGQLRLFAILGIAGGLAAWLWAWSPALRSLQELCLRPVKKGLRAIAVGAGRIRKKILEKCKKIVAFGGKHGKINNSLNIGEIRRMKGGLPVAAGKIIPFDEAAAGGCDGLRADHAGKPPGPHPRRRLRGGRA